MGYFSGGYSLSESGPETDLLLDEINKVFFCQYGVTEYADALTKYNAGKGLYAIYNKKTYLLTDYTNSTFYFAQLNRSLGYASLSLSASGWAVVDSVSVAPLNSPVFTGTPTAPTADENTNDEQIATTAYADRASYNSLMEDTASGSIASFPDGAQNVPVKEMVIQIEPVQSGSGDPSPDNIRPISGYTGAEISDYAENLVSGYLPTQGYYNNSGVWEDHSGFVSSYPIKVSPNTHYVTSLFTKDGTRRNRLVANEVDAYGNIGGMVTLQTFTTSPTTEYLIVRNFSEESTYINADNFVYQLEEGSTPTEMKPVGNHYSVSWSDHGTVYKGTAQYKGGGEWEITEDGGETDMGDLSWAFDSANARMYAYVQDAILAAGRNVDGVLSSCFVADASAASGDVGKMFMTNGNIFVYTNETNPSIFATSVTGQSLVYPLAAPVTFTVNGPDPETLLGDNNIWSNTGDISVKYRCNTALYIEKKLGA